MEVCKSTSTIYVLWQIKKHSNVDQFLRVKDCYLLILHQSDKSINILVLKSFFNSSLSKVPFNSFLFCQSESTQKHDMKICLNNPVKT